MAISSSEIWQRLQTDGLASGSQCHQWKGSLANNLRPEELQDAASVLKGLIALGAINAYQARILAGKSNDPLKYGDWLILGRVPGEVWKDWLQIRRAASDEKDSLPLDSGETNTGESAKISWGRWLNAESVKPLGGAKSLVMRGKEWSRLDADGIQRSEEPTIVNNRLLLRLQPIKGQSLLQCASEAAPTPEHILQIIRGLASSLAVLHGRSIVYGALRPDRVFWDRQQGTKLVCEPVEPVFVVPADSGLGSRNAPSLLNQDLAELPASIFIAPELLNDSHPPRSTSDVYSLGVTWWWLLNRLTPTDSESSIDATGFDCNRLKISQPLAKCLKDCLAKDPALRFSDANQLMKELEAAETSQASSPAAKSSPGRQIPAMQVPTKRRRRTVSLFVPLIATCFFLGLALAVMTWSGAFSVSSRPAESAKEATAAKHNLGQQGSTEPDPLFEHFQLIESQDVLWAPPKPPRPIELLFLPPGIQMLAVLHPSRLAETPNFAAIFRLLRENQPFAKWLENEVETIGIPVQDLRRMTIAIYSPPASRLEDTNGPLTESHDPIELPETLLRVELGRAYDLRNLLSLWSLSSEVEVDSRGVITLDDRRAIYIPPGKLLNTQASEEGISVFCIGSKLLVEEAAELEGAVGPMNPQMKKLLDRSNSDFDFSILASPRFLFSDGKAVLNALPAKMQHLLDSTVGHEGRALLVQSHCDEVWYWEVQAIGARDSDAPQLLENWISQAAQASSQAESWLLQDSPHSYWRALAVRLPEMLRLWNQNTRFGIEDGIALANGYQPPLASSNLLAAFWISLQEGTLILSTGEAAGSDSSSDGERLSESPVLLSTEEYLNRPIRLRFEQESIERAFTLIGEEANDNLPQGSQPIRFELDGSAFQKAGITRNQQIRQFQADGGSVRQALTELARRGNPVSGVDDTRDTKQQLVWLIQEDPTNRGSTRILLTTRTHATENLLLLPVEFAEARKP